jgi:hypothetical protein
VRRLAAAVAVLCVVGVLTSACKSDTEKYCDEVKAQQQRLTELAANPDPAKI